MSQIPMSLFNELRPCIIGLNFYWDTDAVPLGKTKTLFPSSKGVIHGPNISITWQLVTDSQVLPQTASILVI